MAQTAMQQLMDRINDLKSACIDPDAHWLADMLIRDISDGSQFDTSFLAMEKEQMIDFVKNMPMEIGNDDEGNSFVRFNPLEYYNQTYTNGL